jgi:hypothetical protein
MEPPRPLGRRRALQLGAGLLAGPLLGGCAADPDDGGVAGAVGGAGIERLLAARGAAVLRRDRAALLATVDPRAPALRAAQSRLLGNLAQVPLAAWEYRLVSVGAFPLPTEAVGASGPAPRVAAEVQLRYRLAGYDAEPVTATEYLTLVRRARGWLLASDSDGAASGHRGDAQLWDLGPVQAVSGASCLVLGLRQPGPLRGLAAVADRAVPAVRAVWGDGWGSREVLLAPSALDEFGALLDADPAAYQAIAAVTTGELGADKAPADRIIVNPQAYDGLSDFGQAVVLTHETTHVATRAITRTWTPRWLAEGAADWTAYLGSGRTARQIAPELAADVAAGREPAQLPTDADFAPTAARLPQSYEKAWLACETIAAHGGRQAVPAVYRAVSAAGGDGTTATDSALRAVLGVGLTRFTELWRDFVRAEMQARAAPLQQ